MAFTSVFDMLKIGIGPSSSHTLGPWRACEQFIQLLLDKGVIQKVQYVHVDLYGSLALTGKGHGTDIAIILGLSGYDPKTIPIHMVTEVPNQVSDSGDLILNQEIKTSFSKKDSILFHTEETLPFHPNGMTITAYDQSNTILITETYYSVGGGFVTTEHQPASRQSAPETTVPFTFNNSEELMALVHSNEHSLIHMLLQNEFALKEDWEVEQGLDQIIAEMMTCIYRGCHTDGILPGCLEVKRRAPQLHAQLITEQDKYDDISTWKQVLQSKSYSFQETLKWISCFAIAVNEENAAFGRVVTAPTNGAAGVIPAVLMYLTCFAKKENTTETAREFLLIASLIGSLFKEGATISAAKGGCQAEIGVSSSMAAAALTHCLGGCLEQIFMAAEIAMEHHLGLTCDPIEGLVQIPCIERNTMGAIKAITAANLALASDPFDAKISLDDIIQTMWETAKDMDHKYKETSLGGLSNISVCVSEC